MEEKNIDYIKKFKETPVTFILVAINLIVFIVIEIMGGTTNSQLMLRCGVNNYTMVIYYGQWYRLFTCMFLHFGIEHLFNNMLLLFLLGQIFEKAVGSTRFAAIYLGSGMAASFMSLCYQGLTNQNDLIAGASGAIFGIVGGMLIVILVHKGRYHGITIRRMIFMAVLTLYFGFATAGTDNIGHMVGLLFGIVISFFIYGIPTILQNLIRAKRASHVEFEDENKYTLDKSIEDEGR